MGHHYVPQKYLRGFEDVTKPGWIWMYDKKQGTRKLVRIKQVAQEAEFYTEEVEKALADYVEKSANAVIDKLRNGGAIDDVDRAHLAYYAGTMIRRVPHARAKGYSMVPDVLADTVHRVRDHFKEEVRAGRLDAAELEAQLEQVAAAEKKYQMEPPPEVVERIETPWPTQWMLAALFGMVWRFGRSNGPSYFLTSDNPAYFFEAFGLNSSTHWRKCV